MRLFKLLLTLVVLSCATPPGIYVQDDNSFLVRLDPNKTPEENQKIIDNLICVNSSICDAGAVRCRPLRGLTIAYSGNEDSGFSYRHWIDLDQCGYDLSTMKKK